MPLKQRKLWRGEERRGREEEGGERWDRGGGGIKTKRGVRERGRKLLEQLCHINWQLRKLINLNTEKIYTSLCINNTVSL